MTYFNRKHKVDKPDDIDGEIPEDDYVKIMMKLEESIHKNTEMQYEIDSLRRVSNKKDQVSLSPTLIIPI